MRGRRPPKMIHVPAETLRALAATRLRACGVPRADAQVVADSLVQTSLWGIDSHGIARLPHYLRRIQSGSIEAKPAMRFTATGPCTGTLDGGHGLGILVCRRAMDEAIQLARASGVGVVGCHHSTHCGAIGLYGRQAARAGLIGVAFTHSDAFVVPHGGKHAFLGTNPICIAVPSDEGQPVCLDMATAATTMNRMMNARRDGMPLPNGVALDRRGQPTTDAQRVAALLPMAEHKGYALAFLIDVLCGPLNGMPFGPHIPVMYGDLSERRNLGSLMMALDPMRFAGGATLAMTVAAMANEARHQPPAVDGGEVLVPGDPEYRTERVRAVQGIPVEPGLRKELGLDVGPRSRVASRKALGRPARDATNLPARVRKTRSSGTGRLPCKTPSYSA
jgi:ureidoglycolate dehydrogenase (NAD+)